MAIDAEQLIQQIGTSLQADDSLRAYLLIDPMLYEPIDAERIAAAALQCWDIPVRRPGIDDDKRPYLLELRATAVEILEASVVAAIAELENPELESTRGFAVGGWLLSEEPGDVLVRHFSNIMSPIEPGHGIRYFRLADRRVLEWMWPVLESGQHASLMRPIRQWLVLDRRGAVVRYVPPQVSPEPMAAGMPLLQLTEAQWRHAHRCEEVQQMLRGWRAFEDALPHDYLKQADHAVASARSIGLAESADIVLLGAYQLMLHPRLTEHPRIFKAVEDARDQGIPLGLALEKIPDPEGWDAIRRDLERADVPA